MFPTVGSLEHVFHGRVHADSTVVASSESGSDFNAEHSEFCLPGVAQIQRHSPVRHHEHPYQALELIRGLLNTSQSICGRKSSDVQVQLVSESHQR